MMRLPSWCCTMEFYCMSGGEMCNLNWATKITEHEFLDLCKFFWSCISIKWLENFLNEKKNLKTEVVVTGEATSSVHCFVFCKYTSQKKKKMISIKNTKLEEIFFKSFDSSSIELQFLNNFAQFGKPWIWHFLRLRWIRSKFGDHCQQIFGI